MFLPVDNISVLHTINVGECYWTYLENPDFYECKAECANTDIT